VTSKGGEFASLLDLGRFSVEVQTMSDTSAAHPTSSSQRLASLDVLRGFALLGILIMNIQGFAMISAAYSNPSLHMDLSGLNWWVWALSHAFADMKFMAIFSILFGAGIILATKRRDAAGRSSFAFFYRRNGWLLMFGVIHAYLIWFGDILVAYAVAAFVVFWFRGFRVRWLFLTGVIMLSVAPALSIVGLWLSSEEEGVNPSLRSVALGRSDRSRNSGVSGKLVRCVRCASRHLDRAAELHPDLSVLARWWADGHWDGSVQTWHPLS
jgi:uncharacterized membrane protein YeiB